MMSGLNDRLWGDMGVIRVQGTLGATMEPGCVCACCVLCVLWLCVCGRVAAAWQAVGRHGRDEGAGTQHTHNAHLHNDYSPPDDIE